MLHGDQPSPSCERASLTTRARRYHIIGGLAREHVELWALVPTNSATAVVNDANHMSPTLTVIGFGDVAFGYRM